MTCIVIELFVCVCAVGTKWKVLYCVNPNRKSKKMEDGFLQLVQKSSLEIKVRSHVCEGLRMSSIRFGVAR